MEKTTKTEKPEEKTFTRKDVAEVFASYMVPMSKETIDALSENLDQKKMDAITEYAQTTAQGLYPTLAKQIAAGIPVHNLTEPYRQVGKQMLGQEFEPDFVGDPKSVAALHGNTDPATGRAAPMSLDQWRSHLMTTPGFGWDRTPAAHEAAQRIVEAINQGFTQRPTGGSQ